MICTFVHTRDTRNYRKKCHSRLLKTIRISLAYIPIMVVLLEVLICVLLFSPDIRAERARQANYKGLDYKDDMSTRPCDRAAACRRN